MKRTLITAVSAFALTFSAAPVLAQDAEPTAEEMQALTGLFGDMFGTAEPLTAEQEARLPAAQSVVLKLFPEGTYAKMMDETMAPMMDGLMGQIGGTPAIAVGKLTGLSPLDLAGLEDQKLASALELLDPNADERNAAITDYTLDLISGVMIQIEPSYRAGLARAYAVRFTTGELADLDAYFATPVGSKYAAESFLIFADPQVMSSMNEMMPAMMEQMPTMMAGIAEITENYPQGRTFSALSEGEQAQLAELLGVSLEDLAINEPEGADENAAY